MMMQTTRKTNELADRNELIGKKLDEIYFPDSEQKNRSKSKRRRRAKTVNTESSPEIVAKQHHERFLRDKVR